MRLPLIPFGFRYGPVPHCVLILECGPGDLISAGAPMSYRPSELTLVIPQSVALAICIMVLVQMPEQ